MNRPLVASPPWALALYEMVQKRGNLKFKTSEEFPVERFRSLLGVDPGKLEAFKSLEQRAIDPAVLEVNGLGEFGCKVEPSAYAGRKVTAVRLSHQARKLLVAPQEETIKSKRDRAILSTLLFHALRREELCKLKVRDFRHARKGVPHLRVSGKGGKTRYLPLHPGTNALIHDYLADGCP
jgi:integrase